MADVIRMEYAAMEQLIAAFRQAHGDLHDVKRTEGQMAQLLENGALLGTAGAHLASAISGPLMNATGKLAEKMQEEANDCARAMELMKQHDQEAAGKF
jgi:hypothetical protein